MEILNKMFTFVAIKGKPILTKTDYLTMGLP